ncbi:MAG TPA: tRNA pseudouridine(55) synthase TruB [Candidatus Limnocylindrales bacterium]|nr:tRNA pseudouridine(55) synthase TruB [Candidatus Limnocylindrales bacterium]
MLGVVNLDKPVGPTSHDMVGLLRRLTGTRRIGHAGTLDPLASGVLPILVGAATRFSEELTGGRKRYDATIRLGARSATDDAEGPITPSEATLPDPPSVHDALAAFVGTFDQRPPAFSARKHGGQTAHRAARAGAPLDLAARTVTVDAIDVLDIARHDGGLDVRIDLQCGPGTYVRSIARDLGDRLGCGAYLAALRRTEAAGLRADDAVTAGRLEQLTAEGRLAEALLPVGDLLPLPRVELDAEAARRFTHGSAVPSTGDRGRAAVFAGSALLGVGRLDGGLLHPEKVLPAVGSA